MTDYPPPNYSACRLTFTPSREQAAGLRLVARPASIAVPQPTIAGAHNPARWTAFRT